MTTPLVTPLSKSEAAAFRAQLAASALSVKGSQLLAAR